ncbi:histone-lysine N-methyltransferase ASHR1 isoform X2 [Aristolochia californica]|uniref:histone-lysine N-methyltransferase ASHR1 isoform X2 n=1 Tax=Aristolochia californica TaxID=171875 RepID=UPI0035D6AED1
MMADLDGILSRCGLKISFTEEKGRCFIATRNFSPGEVIISQEPYAAVVNPQDGLRCDGCFKSTNLKKCSTCRMVWYCGISCQVIPMTDNNNYELVESLMAHMSEIGEQKLVLYAQMANLVSLILPSLELNLKEIAQNFSKLACNAHTICDSELRPMGTGLYPVISIINHSCLPNSVLVFEEKVAVVRAVDFILKDTEVTISYIETAASTETRQKALKEQYLFTCKCPRCIKLGHIEDIQETATLEGYRCKDMKCDGFLLTNPAENTYICQQCGLLRDQNEIKKLKSEAEQVSNKASVSLSSGHYYEASILYKTLEQLQLELFHCFSTSLLQTRESLLKILMELQDWRGALTCCRSTITVYERVYPPIHPLLGLQYYCCGKLEWFLGEIMEALKSLTKAADILRITHGSSTPFMKELLGKLEEARAEAAYKLRPNQCD